VLEPKVYTVEEICRILKIGKNKGYELVKKIHHLRIGNQIRVPKKCLDEYIENNNE
jgi:excisionase family DNA binding protein